MTSEQEWRKLNTTVAQTLKYIFGKPYLPDVTFAFSNGEQVQAHRLMMAMRCGVLQELFYSDSKPAPTPVVIQCPNNSAAAMRECMRFMYTDTLDLNIDIAVECLSLAKKYNLSEMIYKCEEFIVDCITVPTVLKLYSHCRQFNQAQQETLCLDYILQNGDRVLTMERVDFVKLTQDDLGMIISQDELACDEGTVFQVAVHWAKCKCFENQKPISVETMREEMGGVLFAIRFPMMTLELFKNCMQSERLLTPEEEALIMTHLTCRRLDPAPTSVGPFLAVPRPGRGNVCIYFPIAKATDRCLPGSCDLDIVTDSDCCQLVSISGEHFPVNDVTTVHHSIPGRDPQMCMLCPYVIKNNTVMFTPPVVLCCWFTNIITFESLYDCRETKISKRIRDSHVRIDRVPFRTDSIELHFDDGEDLSPEIDVVGV